MGQSAGKHSRRTGHSDVKVQQQDGSGGTGNTENKAEGEIFLLYPGDCGPGDCDVFFDANLVEANSQYLLTAVTAQGLAEQAGLRDGDQLIGINGRNVEDYSFRYILKFLREETKPVLLLEVKRSQDGSTKYIWSLFELSVTDDVLGLGNVQVFETDNDVVPDAVITEATYWYGNPTRTFDIYDEPDSKNAFYLGIDNNKLQFMSFNKEKCMFLKYTFSSNAPPTAGTVVAYTQQTFGPPVKQNTKNALAAVKKSGDVNVALKNFPSKMVTQMDFTSDQRLWLEKWSRPEQGPVYTTLESFNYRGWFLGRDPKDNSAILSQEATHLMINPSQ